LNYYSLAYFIICSTIKEATVEAHQIFRLSNHYFKIGG
jgi:hypothetical protein